MLFCGSFFCFEQHFCTFDGCRAKTELELDSASLASSGGQSCDRGGHRESLPRNGVSYCSVCVTKVLAFELFSYSLVSLIIIFIKRFGTLLGLV